MSDRPPTTPARTPPCSTCSQLSEVVTRERLRAAMFRHDLEHSTWSWLDRWRAHREWTAVFLGDEGQAA